METLTAAAADRWARGIDNDCVTDVENRRFTRMGRTWTEEQYQAKLDACTGTDTDNDTDTDFTTDRYGYNLDVEPPANTVTRDEYFYFDCDSDGFEEGAVLATGLTRDEAEQIVCRREFTSTAEPVQASNDLAKCPGGTPMNGKTPVNTTAAVAQGKGWSMYEEQDGQLVVVVDAQGNEPVATCG